MIEIKLPRLTGVTEKERMDQVEKYLYQTSQDLNWIIATLEKRIDELERRNK